MLLGLERELQGVLKLASGVYRRCLSKPAGRPVRAAGLPGDNVVRGAAGKCAAPADEVVATEVDVEVAVLAAKEVGMV
jgi:hypothetical protein